MNSGAKNKLLLGQHQAKLDSKGRLFFPSKLKKIIGSWLIITRGYEGSLIIVSQDSWAAVTKDISSKPFIFGPARETSRFILGNASEIKLDSQGRFLLPDYLKKYAGIKNRTVFLGLGQYVEIWNQDRWEEHQKKLETKISSISEKIIEN